MEKSDLDILFFKVLEQNPDGAKLLEILCSKFYDIQSHTPGDSHETAYREGHRAVMQYILRGIASAKTPDEVSKDFTIEE